MGIPHTAVGIFSFMLIAGWLISMLPIFPNGASPLDPITNTATRAQQGIQNSASCLTSGQPLDFNNSAQVSACRGDHWYDAIWNVFSIVGNIITIVVTFLVGMFLSLTVFLAQMLSLPIPAAQIIVALFSVGTLFALLKIIIPDR